MLLVNALLQDLLAELNISPFAVWEKELPRFAHDRRYIGASPFSYLHPT